MSSVVEDEPAWWPTWRQALENALAATTTTHAQILLGWLRDHYERNASSPGPYTAPSSLSGGDGWAPPRPPDGEILCPISLGTEFVWLHCSSPHPLIAPWWDQVAPIMPATDPTMVVKGERLRSEAWSGGDRWRSSGLSRHLVTGAMVFCPTMGTLDVVANAVFEDKHIDGPGFVGSLIPGYAEARKLVSDASIVKARTDIGCRVPLHTMERVSLTVDYVRKAHLFASQEFKRMTAERGYGECHRVTLEVEFTNGWDRQRWMMYAGPFMKGDEQAYVQFADALVRVAAGRRSPTSESNADILGAASSTGLSSRSEDRGDKVRFIHQAVLPDSRPISAPYQSLAALGFADPPPSTAAHATADVHTGPAAAGDAAAARWAQDPWKRHELRYWDGASWTAWISDAGTVARDAGS